MCTGFLPGIFFRARDDGVRDDFTRARARLISLENDSVDKSAAGFISISTLGREGQDGVVAFFRGDCHCASMFRGRAANKE